MYVFLPIIFQGFCSRILLRIILCCAFETPSFLQQSLPHLESKLQSFAIFTATEFWDLVDSRLVLGSSIKLSLVIGITIVNH